MKYIKNLILGTALLGITGVAQAVPTLYYSTTGVAGSYVIANISALGTTSYSSSIGSWYFNVIIGNTAPAVGTAGTPTMTLSIQSATTAAGTLYIGFANDGYTGLGSINATLTGQVVSAPPHGLETYAYTTFADISNVQPINTLPTGSTITSLSGSLDANVNASGALPLTAPYVLGELVQITASDASSYSINANFGFTPAGVSDGGMTLAMLGFGLAALGIARRKLAGA